MNFNNSEIGLTFTKQRSWSFKYLLVKYTELASTNKNSQNLYLNNHIRSPLQSTCTRNLQSTYHHLIESKWDQLIKTPYTNNYGNFYLNKQKLIRRLSKEGNCF